MPAHSFYLNGTPLTSNAPEFLGKALLRRFVIGFEGPAENEAPYLFCGNGACRDCNVLVDGLSDIPSCRIEIAAGMSVRSGDGAGDENALARKIQIGDFGEPLLCDVAVVGAGRSGATAAARARDSGRNVAVLEARTDRAEAPRPAMARDGELFAFESGTPRLVRANEIVLAVGALDVFTGFPGSGLPGVIPLDLAESYARHRYLPGRRILFIGPESRIRPLEGALRGLGVSSVRLLETPETLVSVSGERRVERASFRDGSCVEVDIVAGVLRREPSLALARALGCRTRFDRDRRHDVLEVDEEGRTSLDRIRAVGAMVRAR